MLFVTFIWIYMHIGALFSLFADCIKEYKSKSKINWQIFLFIIYFGISFVKSDITNSKIDDMIEDFKRNAVLNEDISTNKIKYYFGRIETAWAFTIC